MESHAMLVPVSEDKAIEEEEEEEVVGGSE